MSLTTLIDSGKCAIYKKLSESEIEIATVIFNNNQLEHRQLYVYEDSRGVVFCDNSDRNAIAIIYNEDKKQYFIHNCYHGIARECTKKEALEACKTFLRY